MPDRDFIYSGLFVLPAKLCFCRMPAICILCLAKFEGTVSLGIKLKRMMLAEQLQAGIVSAL